VIGVDVFVEADTTPDALGASLEMIATDTPLALKMISNRGTRVYPPTGALTACVDHWRCRFFARTPGAEITDADILDLVQRIGAQYRWMHLEKLQTFDGTQGFTKAQGED
jgi:isocitrate dehydrogenase